MRDQMVLRVVAKMMIPFILLYGCYVQLHGELTPGGGFQAGTIIAAAVILYGLIFGVEAAQKVWPLRIAIRTAATGLLIYLGVGAATIVRQGELLNYSVLNSDPITGQHLGIWLVEMGVCTTVASVMVLIYYLFASHGRTQHHGDGQ